jgi:hypothetical protein
MSKETTKRLKDAHDTIWKHLREKKAAKKAVTPEELAALLSADIRFGGYEADYTELYDTGRSDPLEKKGTQKIRKDIIHAGMSPDHIAEHKKFSNTTGKVKQYMTKYYPSECDAPFEGFIRLSLPSDCPASSGDLGSPAIIITSDRDSCKSYDGTFCPGNQP